MVLEVFSSLSMLCCGMHRDVDPVFCVIQPHENLNSSFSNLLFYGIFQVVFTAIKSASMCIERLHQTSIMGNVINAELDCKGENCYRKYGVTSRTA